jgi:hypothetical protein
LEIFLKRGSSIPQKLETKETEKNEIDCFKNRNERKENSWVLVLKLIQTAVTLKHFMSSIISVENDMN